MRILITGGAGFVGSSLALNYKRENPSAQVIALDNLRRRGSEFNLPLFQKNGIEFVHGDIRNLSDLEDLPGGDFDLMIEASAEPSVLAGLDGSPAYVLQTNLTGTLNCLELARKRAGKFVFLSTSRVYSIAPLRELKLKETATRFELEGMRGIAEDFPTNQARSLYGATKLASELVIQEYAATYGMKAVINRCGVLAGPGQFGKVDQGVFTLWVAHHYFKQKLGYKGFGGKGKQVRDLLHPQDLFELLKKQCARIDECSGEVFNVGGGREVSTSLLELTGLCREVTGNTVSVSENPETTSVDIPLYLSDCSKVSGRFGWKPQRSVRTIVEEIHQWLGTNEAALRSLFKE